jgi:hypothetical protein
VTLRVWLPKGAAVIRVGDRWGYIESVAHKRKVCPCYKQASGGRLGTHSVLPLETDE